jgi:putative membrane-bound dehydrogenase-like protein
VRRIFKFALSAALGVSGLAGATGLVPRATAQESISVGRFPALSIEEAKQAIETLPGYELELVASEPQIASPVAMEFDAAGDLWVVEMLDYSEQEHEALGRVSRLRDRDRDGVMDESEVILKDLSWPTAITCVGDRVWVAAPPQILQLAMRSESTVILDGLGRQNVQGLANSFRWGLDGRVHLSTSSNGGQLTVPPQSPLRTNRSPRNVSGRDIAVDPTSGSLSDMVGYGQHGMDFSPWGDRFVTSNSDHLQQVIAWYLPELTDASLSKSVAWRRSIAIDGPQAEVFRISPVEPWRTIRTQMRLSGASIGLLEGGGRASGYFTSATGITIYDGDQWPTSDSLSGDSLLGIVADVGSNLVHRKKLSRKGVAMVGERIDEAAEFVRSKDTWFRPVQFAHGPDGCLYIVDMARETIEHPKSLPEPIKSQLDLTSGRNLGRIWRIVARDRPIRRDAPGLDRANSDKLVETLAHPNGWHRETASQLLVLKQDATWIPELRTMATSYASPLARLHAISVLATMPHGIDTETWLKTVQDPHPKIRLWSLILLPRFVDHLSASDRKQGFLALRNEQDLEVRMVAAVRSRMAFGIGSDRSDQQDQQDQSDREAIAEVLLAWACSDAGSDDWQCDELRAAVEYAIAGGDVEAFADRVIPILSAQASADSAASWWDAILFQLHQSQRLHTWMERICASEMSPETTERLMASLSRLVNRRQITAPEARTAVEQFARNQALDLVKQSIASEKPSQMSSADRVAVQLLTMLPSEERSTLLNTILNLENKTDLQQAAVDAWLANDQALQAVVLDRWERLSPPVLNGLFQGLVRSIGGTRLLLDRIDAGKMDSKRIPAWAWQAIRSSTDEGIRKRSAQWDSASVSKWEEIRQPYLEVWKQVGAAERGETHFRKWCASCHRVNGIGVQLGPSLDSYRVRTNEAIAIAIAEPSRDLDPKYEQHQIRTNDDETYAGLLSASGTDYIEITSAQNQVSRVAKESIETWTTTGKSFMPDGLLQELGPAALNDLIAFLRKTQ